MSVTGDRCLKTGSLLQESLSLWGEVRESHLQESKQTDYIKKPKEGSKLSAMRKEKSQSAGMVRRSHRSNRV